MTTFNTIIATRKAVNFADPSLTFVKENPRQEFAVPNGTSVTEAVLLVHQSDFMPKDHTCSYSARLSLARYDATLKEIDFSIENLGMPDELHIHDGCLYLSCYISRAAPLSRERKELLRRTGMQPPAKLLRRLVSSGFCEDFVRLCDVGSGEKSGSVSFPNLIKAAKSDCDLHIKREGENGLVVQGMQKGVKLTLYKTVRNTQLSATISGLPANCFGLTYMGITNLCDDAMIVTGHEYGSDIHMKHTTLPQLRNAHVFAQLAKGYVDLAYKMYDVFLEFPDTGEKSTWRVLNDRYRAEAYARAAQMMAEYKAAQKK